MARTTTTAVQEILSPYYNWDAITDVSPFIAAANATVNRVVFKAGQKADASFAADTAAQELVERWLAAHYYCQMDPTYKSRSTAGASGSFDGNTADGFESTRYGQMALRLDYSNCLRNLDKTQKAGAFWVGKVPSEQIDVSQRS